MIRCILSKYKELLADISISFFFKYARAKFRLTRMGIESVKSLSSSLGNQVSYKAH